MDIMRRNPVLGIVAGFVAGFAIGLFIFGWGLTPLQWTDAGPQDLSTNYEGINYQEEYLRTVADLYSQDGNIDRVRRSLQIWPDADQTLCAMAAASLDAGERDRLVSIAAIQNGVGCSNVAAPEADEGGPSLLLTCFIALLLLGAVGAFVFLVLRRGGTVERRPADRPERPRPAAAASVAPPAVVEEDEGTRAIARFRTAYSRGNDSYDDSFPIENVQGDFLGECGVGISESIGEGSPRNVTAFEVWLFDKNDIRTITKVVMSDYAFLDEAVKAKLSPKGEPVLARPNEVVVLETASLIINAEIVEMEYGDEMAYPESSYFDRFTIELSAWTKEDGDDTQIASIDDALSY